MERKPISKKTLWIIVIIALLASIASTIWVYFENDDQNKIPLVVMMISFLVLSFSLNGALTMSIKFKPKKKNYVVNRYEPASFSSLDKTLKEKGFECKETQFGAIYMLIKDLVAYKVVLVYKASNYFNKSDDKNLKKTKGIDECKKFIGFEIFKEDDEELIDKLVDFSFQGDHFYYEAMYLDSNTLELVEPNYVEPNEDYKEVYKNLIDLLDLKKSN